MKKLIALAALGTAPLAACATDDGVTEIHSSTTLAVRVVDGGTTCAEQGLGGQEFRIESPVTGVYAIDAGNSLLFRYYDDTHSIFFYTQSSIRMNGVLVHAGSDTTVWELPKANGWPSLGSIDPATGTYGPTDAVSFCFDYELFLNPNAYAHVGKRYTWDLEKTGYAQPITLNETGTFLAPFEVTVTPTGVTEVGLRIEGPVFVRNPTPYATEIEQVIVTVGELAATVTCPALPRVLAPFSTLTCTFEVFPPDTADRVVIVDVVADGVLPVDRSIETASFTKHTTTITSIDRCVVVHDDQVAGGVLGTVCAADGEATFTYDVEVGPFEACGPFELTNTAWLAGNTTGGGPSASWTIGGDVPCAGGCTLTQGYWKTHSEHGPAPYDATWALLPAGADTPFFASGQTYYQVLWTPPAGGNAYYVLAHQYIAAQLSGLAGASTDAVAGALAEAAGLLAAYTPSSPAVSGKGPTRARFVELAGILDAYNNGLTGPGHCTE